MQKEYFSWPNALYIFSGSPRDGELTKTDHQMLVKRGIRLPNQFLSHNTLLQSKNQAKVAYFTKLMILIFGCPEEIRITNFTRMPPMQPKERRQPEQPRQPGQPRELMRPTGRKQPEQPRQPGQPRQKT